MPEPHTFTLPQARELLARTPEVLRALLGGLSADWLEAREAPGTWCPREVVAHLIENELTDWVPRLRIILAEGKERPFPPFDRTAHLTGPKLPIAELLARFAQLRAANLTELQHKHLDQDDLEREGVHPVLGTVTLRELLATWVVHDLDHLSQIARVLARRYAADCGPWNRPDFLGVLHRELP